MDLQLKYIDLFSGIGGFRLALDSLGLSCVFSCENNEHAAQMYKANFKDDPTCDITQLEPQKIPDFDILCAGFPCQTFSISGKQHGFYDKARGTLFFDICRILKVKKPQAFILENVQNLEKHNKGNTLFVMLQILNELGYSTTYKVLNAKDFGVPQNRERIIIIGSMNGFIFDFDKILYNPVDSMNDFLDNDGDFEYLPDSEYTLLNSNEIKRQKSGLIFCGYRNKKIRTAGTRSNTNHLSRVHKQPNRIYSSDGIHPTIASQEQSGRYYIYIKGKVRKLTISECYRFMGFPENFIKIGSKAKLYERIGNSVCVPMIKCIANELVLQFWNREKKDYNMNETEFLEKKYHEASLLKSIDDLELSSMQKEHIKIIAEHEEVCKGVYTVLVTSLVYKSLNSKQDIRLHQANMTNGYSGRSFDTKYVTPFLKQKKFLGAMKESGWLTRSLEQNAPYDFNFPGKIQNKQVKQSFLCILHDIQVNNVSPEEYLKGLFYLSITYKNNNSVILVNPINRESQLNINEILYLLEEHFYYKYTCRGASILPVIAIYSIYECIIDELARFQDKILKPIASHYSSDKNSGNTGDIVITNHDNSLYEVVEIKFDIKPNVTMINDAYNKFAKTGIQRYYILSTLPPEEEDMEEITKTINKIKLDHGCQVIVNGVLPTIKYYLRLLKNTDLYIEKYIKNIQNHSEINHEHKIAWNMILKK